MVKPILRCEGRISGPQCNVFKMAACARFEANLMNFLQESTKNHKIMPKKYVILTDIARLQQTNVINIFDTITIIFLFIAIIVNSVNLDNFTEGYIQELTGVPYLWQKAGAPKKVLESICGS